MKSITTFDIVLLPFPFTDLTATKKRPALVLHCFDWPKLPRHFLVAMITSQLDGLRFPEDLVIQDWEKCGLPKPSLARLGKLVTVDGSLLVKKLGGLEESDQGKIRKIIKKHYGDLCR